MEQNYERMQEEVPTLSKYVHTDLGFHMLVCECTQNPLAVQILRSYEELLGPSILHMTEVIGAGNGLKYHQLLLEAIRAHDPVQARTVMHRHLEDNIQRFRAMHTQGTEPRNVAGSPAIGDERYGGEQSPRYLLSDRERTEIRKKWRVKGEGSKKNLR